MAELIMFYGSIICGLLFYIAIKDYGRIKD